MRSFDVVQGLGFGGRHVHGEVAKAEGRGRRVAGYRSMCVGKAFEQVVDFFRKSGAIDEPLIQSETDRYIAWPAQALSYKLGQLKFRELRDRAEKELGPKFDIRAFHDEMIDGGTLPLDMLDAHTNRWIAAQKAK